MSPSETAQSDQSAPAEPSLCGLVRRLDDAIGLAEQVVLVFCLAVLIGVGAYQAISTNFLHRGEAWPFEIIRYSVFFIAMSGAAYASHCRQQISLDVVTRLLSPKARTVAAIAVALFVAGICLVLAQRGMVVRHQSLAMQENYEVVPPAFGLLALPVGALLIAVHALLHALIDITHLATGYEAPPDAEAAGEQPVH